MPINFNNPALANTYSAMLVDTRDMNAALAKMDFTGATATPTGTISWSTTNNRFERWNGSSWAAAMPDASTSVRGLVLLNDTVISSSTALGATANSVRVTYELAQATATIAQAGRIQLASNAQVQAGTDNFLAVTPGSLRACTATDTRIGVVELATNAETITGTDTARAVTPAGLSAAMRPSAVTGHIRAGRTQIYDGNSGSPPGTDDQIIVQSSVSEATWTTIGPTGSGATIIWNALDSLPATARALIANVSLMLTSEHATNEHDLLIFAAAGGVTPYQYSSSRVGRVVFDNIAVGSMIGNDSMQFIPMNTSRIFQIYWGGINVSASNVLAILAYRGFLTD